MLDETLLLIRRTTERLQEDLNAQLPHVKYVYWPVHCPGTSLVRNECKLPEADDAEVTASTQICNEIKLYQQTTLSNEREEELPS